MGDLVRVNGNAVDWGALIFKVEGDEFHGFVELSFEEKREHAKLYGTGRHRAPRARTRGKYSATAKAKGPKTTVMALLKKLADANDGQNYGDTEFLGTAQFIEKGEEPILVEIVDCVVASVSDDDSEGNNDASMSSIELDVMYLKRNNLTLFDNSDGVR